MDLGRAFSYVFDDSEWFKKVLIGGLINLVPILNFASTGYFLEVLQKTAWRQETPLPEWGDLGNKWIRGLLLTIIAFIYALPGVILMAFSTVPLIIAGVAERGEGVAVGGMMIFMLLGGLWILLVLLIFPAISVQYALYGNFGAAFRFGDIIKFITQNVGGYIMAIIAFLAAAAIGTIASMVPLVGWIAMIFVYFYAYLVGGHAFGQLAQGLVQQAPASSEAPSES